MKKSIVWLASYPKSGNTWTRMFLANYLANPEKPLSINQAHRFCMGDAIGKTYDMVAGRKIDKSNVKLTVALRPRVLQGIVGNGADVNFVKTHNARINYGQVALIPPEMTRSAIYIVRHPMDMVLSYARHYGISNEQAVYTVCHPDNANNADDENVVEFLGTWSSHVTSWSEKPPFPTLVVKYEDILADPETEFTKILAHIGLPADPARLKKAIEFSSFKELKRQEEETGFVEKSKQSQSFFAKGQKDQWKTDLDKDLISQMRREHKRVMKKFGYW